MTLHFWSVKKYVCEIKIFEKIKNVHKFRVI